VCLQDHGADHKIWFRSMKIRTFAPGAALPPPLATPKGGTYAGAQKVTLDAAVVGAAIYYTLDGSAPSAASTRYTVPINVSSNATLKAVAIRAGSGNSPVTSETYQVGGSSIADAAPRRFAWDLRRGDATLSVRQAGLTRVDIRDARGRTAATWQGRSDEASLSLQGLPPGLYGFQVVAGGASWQARFAWF